MYKYFDLNQRPFLFFADYSPVLSLNKNEKMTNKNEATTIATPNA